MARLSIGGEPFIAQQPKPGSWLVLDRHYREPVGPADKSHEWAERRAAALNAANGRLRAVGHHLERGERDELNAGLQAEAT